MAYYLDLTQWPAMLLTIAAAWLVTSQSKRKRRIGFWTFLLSNALWVIWGLHDEAYALVALQCALAVINIRGGHKNEPTPPGVEEGRVKAGTDAADGCDDHGGSARESEVHD